jgi:NADPH:quinone reductase-like Zn-dependent oxidoreductase
MNQPMMQAIRVYQYGDPGQLILEHVPRPVLQPEEVVVRVHAVGVLPVEWKMRQGHFQGVVPITFPYVPGSAFAGVVDQVGPGVTAFRQGQAVFGRTPFGAYAEYVRAPLETIALKPLVLSFAEAATISGGATVRSLKMVMCKQANGS